MSYKLGICSISFRPHSPEEVLKEMKKAGLSCIEWGSDVHCGPEKAGEIAALQKKYGITCCSYGTYFRLGVTPIEELPGYIAAAKVLGTDILRLWCGNKDAAEYTETEKAALFEQCRLAAEIAEKSRVILCMECHANTYTNTKDSACQLMQTINSPCFRMYWQPSQYRSEAENLEYAKLLSPYTEHLHVFNWKGKKKFPLGDAAKLWKEYLSCFPKNKTLLLEFMPDGKLETLVREALALKEIAE